MSNPNDTSPEQDNLPTQRPPSPKNRLLNTLTVNITLVLAMIVAVGVFVMTAPPPAEIGGPPMLQFEGRSALRKRPSLESAPIAYSKMGMRREILQTEEEWVQIRIEGAISGWTQRNEGIIIPPPPPQLTSRQRAKEKIKGIKDLFAELSKF